MLRGAPPVVARQRAKLGHGQVIDVPVAHDLPPVEMMFDEATSRRRHCQPPSKSRGVHVRVHERGADPSTPLVFVVPPTGIEPATFGTGNQFLTRLGYTETSENRGITRMSEGCTRVYPGREWVHQWVH